MRRQEQINTENKKICEQIEFKIQRQENVESEFNEISKFMSNENYQTMSKLRSKLLSNCYFFTPDQEIYESAPTIYLNEQEFEKQVMPILTTLEYKLFQCP